MPLSTKYHPTKALHRSCTSAVILSFISCLDTCHFVPKGWQFDFIQCWMLKPCIKLATVPEAITVQLFRIHLVTLHGHFKFYHICFTALHHMIVDFQDGASQRANDMFHLGERNLIVRHYTHYHALSSLPIPSKIWLLSNDLQGVSHSFHVWPVW